MQVKCELRHPPADEIYRSGDLSVYEVDGQVSQNLSFHFLYGKTFKIKKKKIFLLNYYVRRDIFHDCCSETKAN